MTGGPRSSRRSPRGLEARLEALRELAARGFAHRAGDIERPAKKLLLGAQRAQPLVVAARNVGAERHARIGRQEVEAQRWLLAQPCAWPLAFGSELVIERPFCHVSATSSPTGPAWCRAWFDPATGRSASRSTSCPSRAAPPCPAR